MKSLQGRDPPNILLSCFPERRGRKGKTLAAPAGPSRPTQERCSEFTGARAINQGANSPTRQPAIFCQFPNRFTGPPSHPPSAGSAPSTDDAFPNSRALLLPSFEFQTNVPGMKDVGSRKPDPGSYNDVDGRDSQRATMRREQDPDAGRSSRRTLPKQRRERRRRRRDQCVVGTYWSASFLVNQ